jgi:hypothetical protein
MSTAHSFPLDIRKRRLFLFAFWKNSTKKACQRSQTVHDQIYSTFFKSRLNKTLLQAADPVLRGVINVTKSTRIHSKMNTRGTDKSYNHPTIAKKSYLW